MSYGGWCWRKLGVMTMFVKILLSVVWLLFECHGKDSIFEKVFAPDLLEAFATHCPKTKYNSCGITPAQKRDRILTCCQECSCDEDCEQFGTCCFPQNGYHFNSSHMPSREGQECMQLEFGDRSMETRNIELFFFVTSKCPAQYSAEPTSQVECRDAQVATWGSLYPVYSPTRRRIYKNMVCARCNGVADGVPWKVFLSCHTPIDRQQDLLAAHFKWLEHGTLPKHCFLRFIFPLSSTLVSSELCYPHAYVINYCEMPTDSDAYNIYNAACTGGFMSPYISDQGRVYLNLFCALCSKRPPYIDRPCPITHREKFISSSFSCVLKYTGATTTIASLQNEKSAVRQHPRACKPISSTMNETNLCVPVFCPSGQVYTGDYECINPSEYWMVDGYSVILKLSLVGVEGDMQQMLEMNLSHNVSLHSTWPRKWQIQKFRFERENNDSYSNGNVSHVLINLYRDTKISTPHSQILDEIREHLSDVWTVTTPYFIAIGSGSFCPYALESKPSFVLYQSIWAITKLHMCRQLVLKHSEFALNAGAFKLQYDNKTLYEYEYDMIDEPNGQFGASICIEDSEYTMVSSGSSSVIYIDSIVFRIAVCFIVAILFIMRKAYRKSRPKRAKRKGYVPSKLSCFGR